MDKMDFEESKTSDQVTLFHSQEQKETSTSNTLQTANNTQTALITHTHTTEPNSINKESLLLYQPPEVVGSKPVQTLVKKVEHSKKNQQVSDVLNAILPPRTYIDPLTGIKIQQCVSTAPSSREDVIALQRKLDEMLQERQARDSGICPVREELYSQCFDELIRQVTLSSPERGLLLVRLRDEIRLSLSAYQFLYQSSITFGMRKSYQAELGKSELENKLAELQAEQTVWSRKVQQQKNKHEQIEKRIADQRAQEEKKMAEEKEFLRYQTQHLESFLKSGQQ